MSRKCIWLLSAYRADSHARWADGLVRYHRAFDWRRFELPGRHFAWRIRGNPLSWLDAFDADCTGDAHSNTQVGSTDDASPDALIATSMVDLATLRGLHPRLAAVPTLLYFHENQFAYPKSDRQITSIDAQMVQLYAALAADRIAFNSDYNRRSFLEGVDRLMQHMPDHVPSGLVERLTTKSAVLPVPVAAIPPALERETALVVWNHRWEYDKNPDLFAEAMIRLDQRGASFQLALLGPRGSRPVPALERLRKTLPGRITIDGVPERGGYESILARAGIVVSTARHEFQGLAVIEAVSAGCWPILPDALCYAEQFDPVHRYPADDPDALVDCLVQALDRRPGPPAAVDRWTGSDLLKRWSFTLGELTEPS